MNKQRALAVYLRGIAMGAADVVPGVSGGTVAFITGIYEELLNSIKSINPQALKVLSQQGLKAAWQHINGNFLLVLALGIFTSILSLARIISYYLENHPLLVWSFFFGLIAASSWHMAKQMKQWNLSLVVALLAGGAIAYVIGELKPASVPAQPLMVFLSGCIAICAMILPGISGSFILVLLGMYGHILGAVKDFNLVLLASFAAGCGCGLLGFAHVLSWLFRRFHELTLALLTGFLLGSLNLVWPWKQTLSYYQNSAGEPVPLTQQNVLPGTYQELYGVDALPEICLFLMLVGVLLVLILEFVGQKTVSE